MGNLELRDFLSTELLEPLPLPLDKPDRVDKMPRSGGQFPRNRKEFLFLGCTRDPHPGWPGFGKKHPKGLRGWRPGQHW